MRSTGWLRARRGALAALAVAAGAAVGVLAAGRGVAASSSTITWTGAGDGTTWEQALNWDQLRVPSAGDRVRLPDVAATSEVLVRSAVLVDELVSAEAIRVRGYDGSLTFAGASARAELSKPLVLELATLRGGVVSFSGAGSLRVRLQATLDAVAVVGAIDLHSDPADLRVTGGLTLDGTMRLTYPSRVEFAGSQVLSGAARVEFRSGGAFEFDQTLTLAPSVTVEGSSASLGGCPHGFCHPGGAARGHLVNLGTMRARPLLDANRGFVPTTGIAVNTVTFANQGTAGAAEEAVLRVLPGAENRGTIALDGGFLRLVGEHTRAALGTIATSQRGGVEVAGTLDNSGASLQVAGGGSVVLDGGTVRGGTVRVGPGGTVESRGGTLDGVRVEGDVRVPGGHGGLRLRRGLTLAGTAWVEPTIWVEGSQALRGPGTFRLAQQYASSGFELTAGTTLTVGADVVVEGTGRIGGPCHGGDDCSGDAAVVVEGTVRALAGVHPRMGDSHLLLDATVTNRGTVAGVGSDAGGGIVELASDPTNLQGTRLVGGAWEARGRGRVAFANPAAGVTALAATVVRDGATASVTRGSLLERNDAMAALAAIEPTGRLELLAGNRLTTASSLANDGVLTVAGAAALGVGGSLRTAGILGVGVGPGPSTGRVTAAGTANLAGVLDVTRPPGFTPGPCDAFRFLAYAGVTGRFSAVHGTEVGDGRRLDLVITSDGATLYTEQDRTLRGGDVTVPEGDSEHVTSVQVRASSPRSRPIDVTWATADGSARAGSDYRSASGRLRIPACATEGTVSVTVLGDRAPEADEQFAVELSAPDGASLERSRAVVTIVDDDGSTPPREGDAVGRTGYWMVGVDGTVYAFGSARHLGNASLGAAPAVDIERTPSGNGYWIVDAAGHVFAFGDAPWLGGVRGPLAGGEAVTSLSGTASGAGYWLFTTRGRVVPFGDARHHGDAAAVRLNGPVLDSIPTPSGQGYYLVGSDGGIFAFGDARFHGSMGAARLNAPVQSLVPDPDGAGYWLVAADGGIFAFEAEFHGSMGSVRLNRPVTGMVGYRRGYLMVAEDGGIFAFGDARFSGSLGDNPPARPITSVAALPA